MAAWRKNTAEGVWSTFGPYFAMMPISFVRETVERLCPEGGAVLDPFMGRGTSLYAARVTGRAGLGADVSPLAWLYSAVKCDPEPDPLRLIDRIADIEAAVRPEDAEPENEFQRWAWCPRVLAFLRSTRRNLDWRGNRTDRTLMGLILVQLHGKRGYSLGNQMAGTKATAPGYSVRWWRDRGMCPPELNPVDYLVDVIARRYRHGVPHGPEIDTRLGPSEEVLPGDDHRRFDLLLTSPPYAGVTDYRRDNWIRLWMLGDLPLPHTSDTSQKYGDKPAYVTMLNAVLRRSAALLTPDATIYVRTDSRPWTRLVTAALLGEVWPDRHAFWRAEQPEKSQTGLLNRTPRGPGETDFLLPGPGAPLPNGFERLPSRCAISTV